VARIFLTFLLAAIAPLCNAWGAALSSLPPVPTSPTPTADWLVQPVAEKAGVFRTANPDEVVLWNGLVSRTFRLSPGGATIAMDNLRTRTTLLRGVKPEAVIEIDGKPFEIGGLIGQEDYAYLKPEWVAGLTAAPGAFQCTGFETGVTEARFPWLRKRYAADLPWPPPGVSLVLHFAPPAEGPKGITVDVHYELYDGLPVIAKWITVRNAGPAAVRITRFTSEILAVVEDESIVDVPDAFHPPQSIQIESDYAFKGSDATTANRVVQWSPDPAYTTQVNYRLQAPLLLECKPPLGPDEEIAPGGAFESFRIFALSHDSSDRERRGLDAAAGMYRALCPWATENPVLCCTLRSSRNGCAVRLAIEQSADVGAEMVILSFGQRARHGAQLQA
jgi:hypothetical protein